MLMDAAVGVERMVVHLELHLGLRRCEVQRLKIGDIHGGWMQVMGKGKGAGKPRKVAWSPETYEELPRWMEERERIIQEVEKLSRKPLADPEPLIIYRQGKKIRSYSDSGLDGIMTRAAERAGIFKQGLHHRNRRTWGRLTMEAAGRDNDKALLIVSEAYGHEDLKQTREYLGLPLDDLQEIQRSRAEYMQRIKKRMQQGLPPEKDFSLRITR
jgi:integrase